MADESLSEEVTSQTEAEAAPKPRARRTTKKAADGAEATPVAQADAKAEAEKPKRTPRKRAAAKEPEAEVEAAAAGEEEPKPKRRRRTKAEIEADKAAAEALAKVMAEVAADEAAAKEAAPKRKRRTKAQIEADEAAAATAAADGQEAPKPEADAEEAKPKRVRTRKKAESADEAQVTPSETEKAEGEKAESAADAPADSEGASDAKKPASKKKASEPLQGSDNSNSRQHHSNNNRSDRRDRRKHRGGNGGGNNNNNRQPREYVPSVSKEDLAELKTPELREKAAEHNIDASGMKKAEMVDAIYEALAIAEGFVEVCGILDILSDGYGFLRTTGYLPGERDVYVGLSTIRRNGLRKGDKVCGHTRPAREGEKFAAIQKVSSINDIPIDEIGSRPKFSDLTPVYPDERLLMEHGKHSITARVIDLAAPIGKGQRGLIVSPPKAGKTTILKDIAASISANNPEVYLMCLLVDERPEEVTDMQRSIKGEVISSTFDMPSENHIAVSELVIERAKRLVEMGRDVVILLDSITRLARAYNLAQPASGRVLSGGVDSTALYPPKRFLGAARNIENGGSLTILASALIDTGSKMDEVIFEEFKGTGNMELKLDRSLADRRIFPAIDPITSGTRKEELLLDNQEAPLIWAVRRILANMNNTERAMDMLIKSLKKTDSNQEFLIRTAKKAQSNTGRSSENFEF
jgi:transcription termination factor Rho